MREMQYESAGGPDRIVAADLPAPRPAAEQVLVGLIATSVNPVAFLSSGQVSFHSRRGSRRGGGGRCKGAWLQGGRPGVCHGRRHSWRYQCRAGGSE
jgi:hypothetical protein